MAYSVKKFIKLRNAVMEKNVMVEENVEAYSEFVNYVCKHAEVIILPMLGKAFREQQFSKEEESAIVDACFNCYTETGARYVAFAINQLSVREEDGEYIVKFDAIADEGLIVTDLQAHVSDGSASYADWQTDWMYRHN